MENEKWKTENKMSAETGENFSAFRSTFFENLDCSACGASARRENARFCLTCGKHLREDYEPLDRLRASYNWRKKDLGIDVANRREKTQIANLFEQNNNSISEMAWACLVYSFVPYLGILFVPFTFFIGGFGYVAARRQPHLGGQKLALVSFLLSFVVLAVQLFLWWLLYIIPEIGNRI